MSLPRVVTLRRYIASLQRVVMSCCFVVSLPRVITSCCHLVWQLSDYLTRRNGWDGFHSMQASLYTCVFVAVLGGGLFLACSIFVGEDKARAHAITHG